MQVNGIPDFSTSKEISCRDCGAVYQVPASLLSSACSQCGNITFHPAFDTRSVKRMAQEEMRYAPIQKSQQVNTQLAQDYHQLLRQPHLNPARAEELAIQYQLEWQLWAKISEDFADLDAHLSYLSFVSRNLLFDRASERYKVHRQKYSLLPEEFWQAEQADDMLEKIALLCEIQFARAHRKKFIPMTQPYQRSLYNLIALGILLFAFAGLLHVITH